jgi:MOSC domain-containing protein YiiM
MLFVHGIGIKLAKQEPLTAVEDVYVSLEKGMDGDVRGSGGRMGKRQITAISENQWRDVCSDMGWDPRKHSWMLRRAGLCISGVWFQPSHIGQFIKVGADAVLEMTGETTPCERMDEIQEGLREVLAVSMRGGVTCRVVRPGIMRMWDPVVILPYDPR